MHYFTLKDHRRPLEFLLRVLECWKPQNEPISKISKNFGKYPKGGPLEKNFFSFLFITVFYSLIPNETIRMPFRVFTMTKSRKLTKKGGLCYRFAMVVFCNRKMPKIGHNSERKIDWEELRNVTDYRLQQRHLFA